MVKNLDVWAPGPPCMSPSILNQLLSLLYTHCLAELNWAFHTFESSANFFSPQNLEWMFRTNTIHVQLHISFLYSSIVEVLKRFDTMWTQLFHSSFHSHLIFSKLNLSCHTHNSPQKVLFAPSAQIIGSSQTQNWKILHHFIFSTS